MKTNPSFQVLFLARPNLLTYPGGDTTQVLQTAKELRNLGLRVDVNPSVIDYGHYDLLHFFNIIDPEDILGHLKKTDLPFVISTIYLDYSEYDKNYRPGPVRWAHQLFSKDTVEYLKTMGKWLLKNERPGDLSFLWRGHRGSIQHILRQAAHLLPNSVNEYQRLLRDYGIEKPYSPIPNGVDLETFQPTEKGNRDIVLCVSRIEGNKNHHHLIKALNDTGFQLYIVGKPSLNQKKYYKECIKMASANIHFTGYVSQEELLRLYRRAKVHVLPSWFETTGLSSLEAAVMGCNIVISDRGDVKEYFEDDAWYCDPADPVSIRSAIEAAFEAPNTNNLRTRIIEEYNWRRAALKTLAVYQKVLTTKTPMHHDTV